MNQELEQLKQLVLDGGFDVESRQHVLDYEQKLAHVTAVEKLGDNPIIKPFVDYLKDQIERAERLLKTDRTLTDRQRDELFARIEISEQFTFVFTGQARQAVEKSIKDLLNVAKTR